MRLGGITPNVIGLGEGLKKKKNKKKKRAMEIENKTIVVWFSCGAASAVAAKKTIEKYGRNNTIYIVNNPIKEEHEDNQRFLKDVETWLGHAIIHAKNMDYPDCSIETVFNVRRYMAGIKGAPCTVQLKKEARYQFERKIDIDYHVLGFTFDEKSRHERFIKTERSNVLSVLIDEAITKDDCFKILNNASVELPAIYKSGFPNANCIGCVKSTSPTYWNLVREKYPEVFKSRAEQSRRIGARLVRYKGERIFIDELPADAKGGKLKSYECGIFCDTE